MKENQMSATVNPFTTPNPPIAVIDDCGSKITLYKFYLNLLKNRGFYSWFESCHPIEQEEIIKRTVAIDEVFQRLKKGTCSQKTFTDTVKDWFLFIEKRMKS